MHPRVVAFWWLISSLVVAATPGGFDVIRRAVQKLRRGGLSDLTASREYYSVSAPSQPHFMLHCLWVATPVLPAVVEVAILGRAAGAADLASRRLVARRGAARQRLERGRTRGGHRHGFSNTWGPALHLSTPSLFMFQREGAQGRGAPQRRAPKLVIVQSYPTTAVHSRHWAAPRFGSRLRQKSDAGQEEGKEEKERRRFGASSPDVPHFEGQPAT